MKASLLALAVITLAAFNLTFRLGHERVTEWDEGLYAQTAFEMLERRNWIATTSDGMLDYSNSKPPLNVWVIGLFMRTFGINLVSLRLGSVISAWLTVVVLLWWAWRRFGPRVSLLAGLVLATTFGFLYVHSGRSGNPDALLTLLFFLIVVVLDRASVKPYERIWLGPLLAGVFLLKGMAVLLPVVLIGFMEMRWRLTPRARWLPVLGACALAAIPVAAWILARWQVDRAVFFERVFFQDFVALSTRALDNQAGSPLFYLNILQKHHQEWIAAMAVAVLLFPPSSWSRVTTSLMFWKGGDDRRAVIGAWSVCAVAIPTLMQTKMPWYLNPFYPMFALGAGWILSHGISQTRTETEFRRRLLGTVIVAASVIAEAKLIYYSYHHRALATSAQGVLLLEADRLRGARVFRSDWNHADAFVLKAMVRGEPASAMNVEDFARRGKPGDYFLASRRRDEHHRSALVPVRASGRFVLFQKQ